MNIIVDKLIDGLEKMPVTLIEAILVIIGSVWVGSILYRVFG